MNRKEMKVAECLLNIFKVRYAESLENKDDYYNVDFIDYGPRGILGIDNWCTAMDGLYSTKFMKELRNESSRATLWYNRVCDLTESMLYKDEWWRNEVKDVYGEDFAAEYFAGVNA